MSVKMLDLSYGNPNDLINVELSDILETIRKKTNFSQREFEVLDHVYRYRVTRVLAVTKIYTDEDLRELHEHLRRASGLIRDFNEYWSTRWRALADVLDARLASLRTRILKE